MTSQNKENSKIKLTKSETILILGGLSMVIAWVVFVAKTNFPKYLECSFLLQAGVCSSDYFLVNSIISVPFIIGSLMIAVGLTFDIQKWAIRSLAIFAIATLVLFLSWQALSYSLLAAHGLS